MNYTCEALTPEMMLEINELENSRKSIAYDLKRAIILPSEAVRKEYMIDSKLLAIKKDAIMKVHITANGAPREIKYLKNQDIWRTFTSGKKPIYGKSETIIIDKLFNFYGLSLNNTKVNDIFRIALKEKSDTENIKEATVKHLESDYKRFFISYSNTLPNKDVRNITTTELKAYTQKWANSTHPTDAVFKSYKGILNLIFGYAYRNGIISLNPVVGIINNAYRKSMSASKTTSEEKIFSEEEIDMIRNEIKKRFKQKKYNDYFINGYAILFSIETGARCGEICSLKWSDIGEDTIWIHSQQLKNNHSWEYCPYTKNERMLPPDKRIGRHFPLTKKIKAILNELKGKQKELGIKSEYVFCHENGEWIKTAAYHSCLRAMCRKVFGKDCKVTNNHAFRMSLNSNILIPKGIPVAERARLLGHSVETNLRRYSFARKNTTKDICELLDA